MEDENVENIKCNSIQLVNFIKDHKDIPDKLLIYQHDNNLNYLLTILQLLEELPDMKLKVVFFTFDYWYRGPTVYTNMWSKIFIANTHHVITFARNLEHLQEHYNTNLVPYREHIHHFNLWCCYEKAILTINQDPILQVAVSGSINPISYPDRAKILKCKGVIRLPIISSEVNTMNNDYNIRLNKYICCFASSVYVRKFPQGIKNTHLILLKNFEILASGALLLCPSSEEPYLNTLGLKVGEHYISTDDYQKTIDYILSPDNRIEIDRIRTIGRLYAIENLNGKKKYGELLELLKRI